MPGSITLEGVTVYAGTFPLLRSIAFSVPEKTAVIVSGRSGCGKSTFLELVAGLRKPDKGRVLWDGTDISTISRKSLLSARQKIGYMFQQHALIANYSVFDNIALPLRTRGVVSDRDVSVKVRSIMEDVALFDVDSLFPEALSAGQQKRAALARALVTNPEMLLLDEPVSGIDNQTAEGIQSIIMHAQIAHPRTVIIISNEPSGWEMLQAERVFIDGGKIVVHHGLPFGSGHTGGAA